MLPNFFVAGVEKAGTTSMYRYLDAHPEVFMSPVKEPGYYLVNPANPPPVDPSWPYTQRRPRDQAAYEALFEGVTTETAVGEASTGYFQSPRAVQRIHDEVPGARIVVILRDPSDRAHSAHTMYVARGFEPITDLWSAIEEEQRERGWRAYLRNGFYADSVLRSLETFGPDRVDILLTDDLRARPQDVVRDVYAFLGVDPDFRPATEERFNTAAVPKHASLTKLTKGSSGVKRALKRVLPSGVRASVKRKAAEWNRAEPDPLSAADRARLIDLYADDIDRTAALLGRDLSAWKVV